LIPKTGDAHWNERSAISRDEDESGRVLVMMDEERVRSEVNRDQLIEIRLLHGYTKTVNPGIPNPGIPDSFAIPKSRDYDRVIPTISGSKYGSNG